MTHRNLTTVDEVIDALDGTSAVAVMTKRRPQHVSNWRSEKRFASHTFLILNDRLKARRLSAPASLWGIEEPPPKKRKKRKASA